MNRTYEIGIGEHIERALAEMTTLATEQGVTVTATFNGTNIAARPGDAPDDLLAQWSSDRAREAEEWRRSPPGIEAAEKWAEAVVQKQRGCDTLVGNLMHIDFTSLHSCLYWLMAFEAVADDVDVWKPTDDILHVFAEYGYEPGVNTGDDFNDDDRENVARYIIGQALDGIRSVGSPHPIIQKFAADWFGVYPENGESND